MRKLPEIQENFLEKIESLLDDRNHGVVLTVVTLVTEMCGINQVTANIFKGVRTRYI